MYEVYYYRLVQAIGMSGTIAWNKVVKSEIFSKFSFTHVNASLRVFEIMYIPKHIDGVAVLVFFGLEIRCIPFYDVNK